MKKIQIETRQDSIRGCGWRKEGGLYLISSGVSKACGKLPLPLKVCPTCGQGIKFSRGFTWINPESLFRNAECDHYDRDTMTGFTRPETQCMGCPLNDDTIHLLGEKAGLLWVGEKFYSIESFLQEAAEQGVSRRILTVPHEFKLGKTWVFLAHKKVFQIGGNDEWDAGIFQVFKPTAIEYVVKGDEDPEKLERMVKKGITPVRIQKMDDKGERVFDSKIEELGFKAGKTLGKLLP